MNFDFRLPQTDAVLSALRPFANGRVLRVLPSRGLLEERMARVPGMEAEEWSRLSALGGGEFEAVLCAGVVDHLEDGGERAAVLREAARLLRPGGRLIVTALHYNFRFELFRIPKQGRSDGVFYHRYSLDEFRGLLRPAWRLQRLCGVWTYLPKTYPVYTRLGRLVVPCERLLRRTRWSLRYGKILLAVCTYDDCAATA